CKFRCKYKALADRLATRINPDLPLGAPPLGSQFPPPCRIPFPAVQCSLSDRSSPSWLFSQMDVVASLGALFRRHTIQLCIRTALKRAREVCSCAADRSIKTNERSKRERFDTFVRRFQTFGDCRFSRFANRDFELFDFSRSLPFSDAW